MKALFNTKTSVKALWRLCYLLPVIFALSSCVQTIFTVQFPQKGQTYIGDDLVDFVVNYSKSVSKADIYLNGVPIGSEFNYGHSSAKASIVTLKKYLKQGVNTLTVDPMAFGPTVTFIVDNAGPEIIVTYGKTSGAGTTIEIRGELRDASNVSSLTLNVVKVTGVNETTGEVIRSTGPAINIPLNSAGKFSKVGIPVTGVTIYSFTATDVHGQITNKEFLADSNEIPAMAISNAMRMAIGDSFIESLRPLIASSLYTTLKKAPIDIRNTCWNDPNKTGSPSQNPDGGFCTSGNDGSTFNQGLNPVAVDIGLGPMQAIIKRLYMVPGATALLNGMKVEAGNNLKIDMIITEMTVALDIKGTILGFIPLNLTMGMTIGRTVVDTRAHVQAINKKFDVQLTDSNFALEGITVTETTIWGIPITGLVDLIMPLLEGVIADLLPGILNPILEDNLNKIVIGACMYPKDNITNVACNNPSSSALFNWAVNVETLKTDNLYGTNNPYDLIVGLETRFNLLKGDVNANPTLGPVYVEDPVDLGLIFNSLGETGTNLTLAISSNAINQAFSALYQTGFSHFNFINGEISYGASKPVGTNGQTLIRLWPESPPIFTLNPVGGGVGGAAAARIGYESAYMYVDKNENGVWKEQLKLGVDFSIAANISQEENAVRLGVEGSPSFNLRSMVNNTGLPFTQSMLQSLVDLVFMYFVPELADQFVVVDLGKFADTSLNGSQVLYLSDKDVYTQGTPVQGTGPDGKATCSIPSQTNGADGKYDFVCETVNFVLNTNTLTSTGQKGTNLMFQMEARDPDIPAAPASPRFDLDGDSVPDYKDNCAAPILMQVAAIKLEGGLVPANVDANGNPVNNFENRIKGHINRWVAKERGITIPTSGDYLEYLRTGTASIAGSGTPAIPVPADVVWWNQMRKGDASISSGNLGTYPWIRMIYANTNQMNSDGDRIGELCEDDNDRDYIYTNNGNPKDTCPTVLDSSNNPGACSIDRASYVLFKNQRTGQCLNHGQYAGTNGDNDGATVPGNFSLGNTGGAGTVMSFANCNVNDLGQRFYVDVSPRDGSHADRGLCISNGTACTERLINIYTNEYKQTEPGFYDTVNHHYVAATIANQPGNRNSCSSRYWPNDDVIVTTMCGYDQNWRDWVLSLSGNTTYPYLIESWRVWEVYGPSRRDCIFKKDSNPNADADAGSCFPSDATERQRASFQVLLGPQQVPWQGLFSGQ